MYILTSSSGCDNLTHFPALKFIDLCGIDLDASIVSSIAKR